MDPVATRASKKRKSRGSSKVPKLRSQVNDLNDNCDTSRPTAVVLHLEEQYTKSQEASAAIFDELITLKHQLEERADIIRQRKAALEKKYKACARQNGNMAATDNDVLHLNVGGTRVVCKRSTLTLIPSSKLAMMFSGRWDKKLLRDKQNLIFLDVNPTCFKTIVTYLDARAASSQTSAHPLPAVSQELKPSFTAMCSFFGITANAITEPDPYFQRACDDDDLYNNLRTLVEEEYQLNDYLEGELEKQERLFEEEEEFVNSFACGDSDDIVRLDVINGDALSVRRSTLRQYEGSVLYHQFDEAAWRQVSSDEGVLVTQPAYAFGKLIEQLRLRAITTVEDAMPLVNIAPSERQKYEAVVHYNFPGQEYDLVPSFSMILDSRDHKSQLLEWIQESLPASAAAVELCLLYRGSRDGFRASEFHAKCDGKGATVTIVKSEEGYICGGYTDQSWEDNGNGFIETREAFLFSFVSKSGHAPVKLPLMPGDDKYAMHYDDDNNGPSFGAWRDCNDGDDLPDLYLDVENSTCYANAGYCYALTPEQNEMGLLSGEEYEMIEMEVFAVK